MEAGTSTAVPITGTELQHRESKLRELEKASQGTDDDIDKVLDVLIPEGDPILQT